MTPIRHSNGGLPVHHTAGHSLIAGIDVGGTKTHLRVERDGVVVHDATVPTQRWQRGGLLTDTENTSRLLNLLYEVDGARQASLVVGAHLDNDREAREFNRILADKHNGSALGVSDVELLGPAVGLDDVIGVIVGTGAKVVGRTPAGASVSAYGYGFLLSDPGSAPALARESVRAVLEGCDRGLAPDALGLSLMDHFGVDDEVALANAFTDNAKPTAWAVLAPLVFAAADAGSDLAASVIDNAALQLAVGVGQVCSRGAAVRAVICAGGVITNQPRLYQALTRHIGGLGLGLTVGLLTVPPVVGALALARNLPHLSTTTTTQRRVI